MATIRVTPEALDTAAGNIENLADQYHSQYENFFKLVEDLAATWQGEDNVAFAQKVNEFRDDFEKMFSEMNQYSSFLRNSATAYRNTQEDAKNRAQALSGNYNG